MRPQALPSTSAAEWPETPRWLPSIDRLTDESALIPVPTQLSTTEKQSAELVGLLVWSIVHGGW